MNSANSFLYVGVKITRDNGDDLDAADTVGPVNNPQSLFASGRVAERHSYNEFDEYLRIPGVSGDTAESWKQSEFVTIDVRIVLQERGRQDE